MKKIIALNTDHTESLEDKTKAALQAINPKVTKGIFFDKIEKQIRNRQMNIVFQILKEVFGEQNVTLSKKMGIRIKNSDKQKEDSTVKTLIDKLTNLQETPGRKPLAELPEELQKLLELLNGPIAKSESHTDSLYSIGEEISFISESSDLEGFLGKTPPSRRNSTHRSSEKEAEIYTPTLGRGLGLNSTPLDSRIGLGLSGLTKPSLPSEELSDDDSSDDDWGNEEAPVNIPTVNIPTWFPEELIVTKNERKPIDRSTYDENGEKVYGFKTINNNGVPNNSSETSDSITLTNGLALAITTEITSQRSASSEEFGFGDNDSLNSFGFGDDPKEGITTNTSSSPTQSLEVPPRPSLSLSSSSSSPTQSLDTPLSLSTHTISSQTNTVIRDLPSIEVTRTEIGTSTTTDKQQNSHETPHSKYLKIQPEATAHNHTSLSIKEKAEPFINTPKQPVVAHQKSIANHPPVPPRPSKPGVLATNQNSVESNSTPKTIYLTSEPIFENPRNLLGLLPSPSPSPSATRHNPTTTSAPPNTSIPAPQNHSLTEPIYGTLASTGYSTSPTRHKPTTQDLTKTPETSPSRPPKPVTTSDAQTKKFEKIYGTDAAPPSATPPTPQEIVAMKKKLNESLNKPEDIERFFALIPTMSKENKTPFKEEKDRYKNVLPYEGNHLKLQDDTYVNSSKSNQFKKHDVYFTQGPLNDTTQNGIERKTVADHQNLIYQKNIGVVVKLTADMEGGIHKSAPYYEPTAGQTQGIFTTETIKPNTDYNQVTIKAYEKTVTLYDVTSWPDHGVPTTTTEMIALAKTIVSNTKEQQQPILIHCSAGIGRTGTFAAILHAVMQLEKKELPLMPADIVTKLREDRPGMVQTLDQYKFIHQAYIALLNEKLPKHMN